MGRFLPIDPAAAVSAAGDFVPVDLDAAGAAAVSNPADAPPAEPSPAPAVRHDGWTAERQGAFLEALAASGCVTEAAAAAGLSASSAYRLRARTQGDAFDRGWSEALRLASERLVTVAFDRAVNGAERAVWHKGERVGTERVPSDRMLMHLLERYAGFAGRESAAAGYDQRRAARDRFEEALDEIAHPELYLDDDDDDDAEEE